LASYADYWDTLISWGKHLEGFQGHASEHTPISADVSYGKTRSDCSGFYSKEPVAQNLFIGRYIVDMESTKTDCFITSLYWLPQ